MNVSTISITTIKINEHSVPVPEGLSELLADTWVSTPKENEYLKDYDRQVIKRSDGFVTFLSKKS